MPKFDWYQATIDAYPRDITGALMELPDAHDLVHGRGRLNYRESASIVTVDGNVLATVLHGGMNGAPNAFGTGDNAPAFADIIRATWPDAHRVTRLDDTEDVKMPFGAAHSACQAIAAELGVKGNTHTPDDPEDGFTYYMGAKTSRQRIRVYEKGKEQRGKGDPEADPDVLRFELQLRPNDAQSRVRAARLAPGEAWGATPLARRVAGVFHHDVQRVVLRQRLVSTYDRTHAAMLAQYGGHLAEMLARHGAWDLVGEQLGLDLGFSPVL